MRQLKGKGGRVPNRYNFFFSTLSHGNRFAILKLLMGKGPLSVSEIVRETDFDQATVSRNLRRLALCQYVFSKVDGKRRIYSLNEETIVPLLKLIDKHVKKFCPWCF